MAQYLHLDRSYPSGTAERKPAFREAAVITRAGLDVEPRTELYTGRRADVERLRVQLEGS